MTPKSYLSFLDGYKTLYGKKHGEIDELAGRMNTGLEKLIEASASVDQLSKELAVKEKELAVANKKADKVCKGQFTRCFIGVSFFPDQKRVFSAPEPKALVHYCDNALSIFRRPSVRRR